MEGCGKSSLHSFRTHTQTLTPRAKATAWKAPEPFEKEVHCLILRWVVKGQESDRTFSGDRVLARTIRLFIFLPLLHLVVWALVSGISVILNQPT